MSKVEIDVDTARPRQGANGVRNRLLLDGRKNSLLYLNIVQINFWDGADQVFSVPFMRPIN